jgi:hypothetical protein
MRTPEYATRRITHIVIAARLMIDAVATASGDPAFQIAQLTDQSRMVEQSHPLTVQRREKLGVDSRLRWSVA